MSKMNKTQVNHLQDRLMKSMNDAIQSKFKIKPSKPLEHDAIEKEIARIVRVLGYTGSNTYSLRTIAREIVMQVDPKLAAFNEKVMEERKDYRTAKMSEINEILDCAILGDSTEALEALKVFKAGL